MVVKIFPTLIMINPHMTTPNHTVFEKDITYVS